MILKNIILFSVFLQLTCSSFSQTKSSVKPLPVSIDTSKRYSFYTALVYFSGNGLQQPKVAQFYSTDLVGMLKLVDSSSKGAIVTFDYLKYHSGDSIKLITPIPYTFKQNIDTVKKESPSITELKRLMTCEILSGTIYFSGYPFTNVVTVTAKEKVLLSKLYARSSPGTVITYDYCIFKNPNGSVSKPISKSIKLE